MSAASVENRFATELGQSTRILGLNLNALSSIGRGLLLKWYFIIYSLILQLRSASVIKMCAQHVNPLSLELFT